MKVLVVDDEKMIRDMVSALLVTQGHTVATADTGLQGVERIGQDVPDLIISDVLMPEMDGYEFCTKVRSLPETRRTPFLMLTSLDSVDQKIKGFEVGADDYIVKPFIPQEFLLRVASLLKSSARLKQAPQPAEKTVGKVIAVHSLRGGSGVTTLAANVAVGLAQIWQRPTILVDLVLTGGQSALFLNQPLKHTWAELGQVHVDDLDEALLEAVLLPHDSGVQTLAAPNRPEFSELITPEAVTKVLGILKETNEYIVLDLPHDFSSTTLAGLDAADLRLVVLQPEIVSIRSARIVLDTFHDLEYPDDEIHLILNWTFPDKGIALDAIQKFLGKKISLVIPYTPDELIEGLNYGKPTAYTSPERSTGMLFEDLALALSKESHRKSKPDEPTEAWLRVVKRYRERKTPI